MNFMRSCLVMGLTAHGSWRVRVCFHSAEGMTPGRRCGPRDGCIPDNVATAQGLSGVTAFFPVPLGHAYFFPSSWCPLSCCHQVFLIMAGVHGFHNQKVTEASLHPVLLTLNSCFLKFWIPATAWARNLSFSKTQRGVAVVLGTGVAAAWYWSDCEEISLVQGQRSPSKNIVAGEVAVQHCRDFEAPFHIQGQRRNPRKMVGGAKLHLESNPIPSRDAQGAQINLVCSRTKRPHTLRQNCVWVSPMEVQVNSGLLQRQGLWVQQTW